MNSIIEKIEIGESILYHGDALKILPVLIEEGLQADCLVSDPPYLLTSGGATEGGMHERLGGAGYNNGGHLVACDLDWTDFMPLFHAALGRGHAYVMANNRNVQAMLNAAQAAEFEFHNLLVWDKVTATPNRWYMKNCEFTGLFYKGKARAINDCASMSCIRQPHTDESNHPTEKPVSLMQHYITNSTEPGGLVIDPFMGSGSTGVAALKSGRRFVGIELEKSHFRESARRIEEASRYVQPAMF